MTVLLRTQSRVVYFGVPAAVNQGVTVTSEDFAVGAAAATPREADPVEDVAPKLSVRLLGTYGADPDIVKGHAA